MAIAIDASSPAAKTATTTTTQTTASFTPPIGSIIVAVASVGNSTGASANGLTISDSLSGSWTVDKTANTTGQGTAQVVRRTTSTSGAAMTVSCAKTGGTNNKGIQLKVFVLTGADTTTPLGATASGTTGTTSKVSITTTSAASIVVGELTYTNASTTLSGPVSGTTSDLATADATNGETYGSFHKIIGATGAQDVGWTNTGLGAVVQIVAAEYMPGSGDATVTPSNIAAVTTFSSATISAISPIILPTIKNTVALKPGLFKPGTPR